MKLEQLLARRQAVADQNAAAQATKGSGWHLYDPGSEQRHNRLELALTDRPIALQDDDTIHVVGECAAKVRSALTSFLADLEEKKRVARDKGRADPDVLASGPKYQAACVKWARAALAQGDDHVELPTQGWNYANTILTAWGVQVVLASADE